MDRKRLLLFKVLCVVVLCCFTLPARTETRNTQAAAMPFPISPRSLFFPYFNTRGGWDSVLSLNNARRRPIQVSLVAYAMSGESLSLGQTNLDPLESRFLDLKSLLLQSSAHGHFLEGSLEVRYEGQVLAVGAQLTVHDPQHSLSFDMEPPSPGVHSSTLEGLWWSLDDQTEAQVMITNTSLVRTNVSPLVHWRGGSYPHPPISVSSHETIILPIARLLKDLRLDDQGIGTGGLTLTYEGPPGSVIAHGFLSDKERGFSSNLNFADPLTLSSSGLEGTGLLLGRAPDEPVFSSGHLFTPVLVLRSLSSSAQTVTVHLQYEMGGRPVKKELPGIELRPSDVRMEDFSALVNSFEQSAVRNAGISISSTGAPGAFMAQLTSLSERGDLSLDVPLKSIRQGIYGSGAHPFYRLSADGVVLYLKNIGDEPTTVLLDVAHDAGTFSPDLIRLESGQSITVDIRKLRDSGIFDRHGLQLPPDLEQGQVQWFQHGGQSVIGHLVSSVSSAGIAAISACPQICCTAPSYVGPLRIELTDSSGQPATSGEVGEVITITVKEPITRGCPDGIRVPDVIDVTDSATVKIDNPSVLRQDSNRKATFVGSGTANITATYNAIEMDPQPVDPSCDTGTGFLPGPMPTDPPPPDCTTNCTLPFVSPTPTAEASVTSTKPTYRIIVVSDTGSVERSDCPGIYRRQITYQIVRFPSRKPPGIFLDFNERFENPTDNTCGNGRPPLHSCATTNTDGIFTDIISVNCGAADGCNSNPNCGYTHTQVFYTCPSNNSQDIAHLFNEVRCKKILLAGISKFETGAILPQ